MANLKILKDVLDGNGNNMLFNGEIVVDESTGVSFSQHHANADIHLSTAERGYLTAAGAANGVALLDADGHLPSGVFDSTKMPVEKTVATIAARDALTKVPDGYKVFVEDATGDTTVKAGWAIYRYHLAVGELPAGWTKVSEAESLDVVTDWTSITNKPTSPVASIDEAVAQKHTHANKATLDALSADSTSGNLTFNGKELNGETGLSFVANAGDTPVFTGKMVFVVENYARPNA